MLQWQLGSTFGTRLNGNNMTVFSCGRSVKTEIVKSTQHENHSRINFSMAPGRNSPSFILEKSHCENGIFFSLCETHFLFSFLFVNRMASPLQVKQLIVLLHGLHPSWMGMFEVRTCWAGETTRWHWCLCHVMFVEFVCGAGSGVRHAVCNTDKVLKRCLQLDASQKALANKDRTIASLSDCE